MYPPKVRLTVRPQAQFFKRRAKRQSRSTVDRETPRDWRLQAASPLLDFGPSPATYTGSPCLDLDGTPRLKDHNGDGLPKIDPGAYERRNTTLTPGGVANARWISKTVLTWDTTPGAAEYHVYRDLRSNLSYANFGVCRDDLDATRTDTQLTDTSNPAAGQCLVYVIATDDLGGPGGAEGTMCEAKCMEWSNSAPCP